MPLLERLGSSLFCLAFPAPCRLCARPLRHAGRVPVCTECLDAVPPLEVPGCRQCGRYFASVESVADGRCLNCMADPPAYTAALCATAYDGEAQTLVHLLKFAGVDTLADFWARRLQPLAAWLPNAPDLVVPVPLGRKRMAERGYNQSAAVARRLAGRMGVAFEARGLRRVRETAPQSGLNAATRAKNVAGAFRADPRRVAGRRILLIDDVLTTGSTAREAAKALRAAGASDVQLLALARADLETARAREAVA